MKWAFHIEKDVIQWRLHLKSPPSAVYEMIATDEGRAKFWAESAVEHEGLIHFIFPNHQTWKGRVLKRRTARKLVFEYFGGSTVTFDLWDDGSGGTVLTLTDEGLKTSDRIEAVAGWVSVLMALKAAVDFGVDLRNHDPQRTWDEGFVEN
ncbi:MAG: SRPBCC family protein [Blastocatellia bacterium]